MCFRNLIISEPDTIYEDRDARSGHRPRRHVDQSMPNSDQRWHQQYHGLPTNYGPRGSYPPPQYALPPPIKIPAFDGKTEWKTWIVRFETIAARQGWSEDDKLDQLMPRLDGLYDEYQRFGVEFNKEPRIIDEAVY